MVMNPFAYFGEDCFSIRRIPKLSKRNVALGGYQSVNLDENVQRVISSESANSGPVWSFVKPAVTVACAALCFKR